MVDVFTRELVRGNRRIEEIITVGWVFEVFSIRVGLGCYFFFLMFIQWFLFYQKKLLFLVLFGICVLVFFLDDSCSGDKGFSVGNVVDSEIVFLQVCRSIRQYLLVFFYFGGLSLDLFVGVEFFISWFFLMEIFLLKFFIFSLRRFEFSVYFFEGLVGYF